MEVRFAHKECDGRLSALVSEKRRQVNDHSLVVSIETPFGVVRSDEIMFPSSWAELAALPIYLGNGLSLDWDDAKRTAKLLTLI
jgi:hypothetical protein